MKIVYIHQYFKTPKNHGGTRSYHLAKAMVSSGHEVHLITSHNASEYKVAHIEGICVCYIPVPYRQEFSPLRKLRAHAHFAYHAYRKARALKNVDLIYATSTPLTVGLIALLLNKTKGTRYFFEVRDIWPEVPIALGMVKNRVTRQLLCRMTREIYRNASAVISLSPGITQLIDKYNTRTPVHELPNFSDTSLFRPLPPNQELKRTYLKEGEMGIVHFGAIGRINHLDYFLDAAGASKQAKLPLRFFIIGEGSEEKRLKKEAHLQDLDNVVFVPPVPKKRMPDWLSIMDFSYITVKNVPILSTNSANKLYDSLAAGKICITNIEGWMQQMVERERCGLNIDPLDPSAFVEQIRPFIENEHLRKQYAAHARAVSEKYYSAEIVSGNLLGILDSYSPEPRPEGNLIGEDPRYCHSAPDATSLPSPPLLPRVTTLKRVFDFLFALAALIVLVVPTCMISLLVWLSCGRVFFRQRRLGLHGRPFTILKFRSMTEARDMEGNLLPDHLRLTRVGRFLRRTSLDELPELINVLMGEMSIVGPRPLLLQYWERYSPQQRRRNEVKPGLTGWAQINGRNALEWPQKFALDVWYVDHQSFWLDLKIVLLTAWKVLRQEGISQPNHATMEEFRG